MNEPAFTIEDAGGRAVPPPVMARMRKVDAGNRLVAARNALEAAKGAMTETHRAIWAARLTTGLTDIASVEAHVDVVIGCLNEVKRLAAEARARVEGVPA